MIDHIYQQPEFGENWFSYAKLYADVVSKFPSGSKFVEVGSWKGKSSAFMAVEIANSNKSISFTCVDTWMGSVEHQEINKEELSSLYDTFTTNMKPLENYYTPMRAPSLEAVTRFPDESLDFIFIDASHEYQDVLADIQAWWPKLKPGGILAGDDFCLSWPGVIQAVRESFARFDIMEGCWVVGKPAHAVPKVVGYAICKNEEHNIEKFIQNVSNFDDVYVLDTGSTDKTVELLKQHNVKVTEKQYPSFDFAQARNDCLDLIPTDVDWCISLDFNERMDMPPSAIDDIRYSYLNSAYLTKCFLYNFDEQKYIEVESKIKVHRRNGFSWVRPVHEEISRTSSWGNISSKSGLNFFKYSPTTAHKTSFYKELCLKEFEKNEYDPYYIRFLLDYSFEEKDWNNVYNYGIRYLNLTESQTNWFRPRTFILLSKYFKQQNDLENAKDFAFHALSESLRYKNHYPFWVRDSYNNLKDLGVIINERAE
jgi:hypothetical protein